MQFLGIESLRVLGVLQYHLYIGDEDTTDVHVHCSRQMSDDGKSCKTSGKQDGQTEKSGFESDKAAVI